MDPDADTTCGHVYTRPSTGRPGGGYTITATVTYDVTWSATGPGLAIDDRPLGPIIGTGTYPIVIREAQAVINN